MPKVNRGLPKDFNLNIDAPVQLGDYLDDPAPVPPVQTAAPREVGPYSRAPATSPTLPFSVPALPLSDVGDVSSKVVRAVEPAPATNSQDIENVRIPRTAGPPRKQFNMSSDTLRMVDELLIHIRNNSAERDVRASELFHALVLAIHEVRPYLDLSRVSPRGKWGSRTAFALPEAMKEAFQDAMARAKARR